MVQDLGAVPVVIPTVDTYDAASKGVIEGTYSAWPGLTTFKWGEVLPYTVENFRTAPASIQYVVMNKEKWNALPPDIQQIMDKLYEEYEVKICSGLGEDDSQNRSAVWRRPNMSPPL